MSSIFSEESLNEWKSLENDFYKEEFGKSTEEIFQEHRIMALEELDLDIGYEEYNDILAEFDRSMESKLDKETYVDDPGFLTNKEKLKIGKNLIYNEMVKKYGSIWSSPNVKKDILTLIQQFIVKNLSNLSTRGPSRKVLFTASDELNFFTAAQCDKKDIKELVKKSDAIESNWNVSAKELNILFGLLVLFYYNNMTKEELKIKEKEKTPAYIVSLFCAIRFYSTLQQKYFKYGVGDEELMNACIENMSGRYLIKEKNNIFELISFVAFTNIDNMIDSIKNPIDFNLQYFITNMVNRLNYLIKSIAQEFYKYRDSGKDAVIQNIQSENEEGDTFLNIPESISNDIAIITRKLIIKINSDNTADDFCLSLACKQTKGNKEKIKISINNMIENDLDQLGTLIKDILAYYLGSLKQSKKTIKSAKFLTLVKKIVSISNCTDPFVIEIKKILDDLLTKNSEEYRKTNRMGTLSVLKNTVFYYIVNYICKYVEN